MRKILLLFPLCTAAQGWLQLADWPGTKRDDGIATVVGRKAYFGTGLQEWNATIDFRVLDLDNRNWSTMQDMPNTTERQYACAFAGNNCFYVSCGLGVGGALSNTYRYDIAANTWSQVASKPGPGIYGAACVCFNDYIFLAGGRFNNSSPNHEVWQYQISTNTWTRKNDFPFSPPYRASAAGSYLFAGIDSAGSFRNELYSYDPIPDQWYLVSTYPGSGRAYVAMQYSSQQLFMFGGFDSLGTYYNDSFFYRPGTQQWFNGLALPGLPRRGGMSAMSDNNFYYTCGLSPNGRLTETWMTDIPTAAEEWSESPDVNVFFYEGVLNLRGVKSYDKVRIHDLLGQEVCESEIHQQNEQLDVSFLPAQVYAVVLSSKDGSVFTCKRVR